MSLDLDMNKIFECVSGKSIIQNKLESCFRCSYVNDEMFICNKAKKFIVDELVNSVDQGKILKNSLSYYIDKLHYLYKLAVKILNDKKFFRYHKKLKRIVYEEDIFLTDTDDNLLVFIVATLTDDEHEKPFIEVIEDSNYLFNLLVKLTIKFFNKKVTRQNNKDPNFDMRKLSRDWRWLIRCRILEYIKEFPDEKISKIAEKFKVSFKVVKKIFSKYQENINITYDDLKENQRGPQENPFNVISAEYLNELEYCLVEKIPNDFDLDFSSWSGACIQAFLKKEFNLEVSMSYLYYFLARNNITSKFAQRRNSRRNPRKIKEFLQVKYKEIIKLAAAYNAKIVFGDETHVQQGYDKKGYAPRGKRTHLGHNQSCRHTDCSLFTIMGSDGFFRSFMVKGSFTSEKFIECLQILHEENPKTVFFLILDNSHVHDSETVRIWLDSLKEKDENFIFIDFLPKYCPEMNPVEYFNQEFKGYLKSKNLRNSKDVEKAAAAYIDSYNNDNEETRKHVQHFFMGEGCSYSIIQIMDYLISEK